MSSVIFDTAVDKQIQTGLRLGAAQYYLSRRGGWHEHEGVEVTPRNENLHYVWDDAIIVELENKLSQRPEGVYSNRAWT